MKGGGRHARPASRLSLTLAVFLLLGGTASGQAVQAQPAPVALCRSSLPCLLQMVDDLREYRIYLEDQLSLAKSLLGQANGRIAEQAKALQVLREAGAAPEKKVP